MIGCLMLVLLSVPASGQSKETVTVEMDRGLAGFWRIEVPGNFHVNFFQNAQFGPMRPIYCRVQETYEVHCLSGGYSTHGTVTQDGNKVHVAWGSAMARMAIDADITPDGFAGTFSFKFSGIRHDVPTNSTSTHLSGMAQAQSVNASDNSNQLSADVVRMVTSALPNLGPVAQIAYLGTSPSFQGDGDPDYFRVYAIEFDNGERICGLHGQDPLKCI
jgi:hypothetical protein